MRQGTAMRQPTAIRGDVNMNIVNRPVTNHGLGGIKGLNVGPGLNLFIFRKISHRQKLCFELVKTKDVRNLLGN